MDATYTNGTNEYVVVKLERTALSGDYDPDKWQYGMCLSPVDASFDATKATWASASYELAAGKHHTVKALLSQLGAAAGRYAVYVRLTSTTETETPTYLRASGTVRIT